MGAKNIFVPDNFFDKGTERPLFYCYKRFNRCIMVPILIY